MPSLRAPVSMPGCLYSPFPDTVKLNWPGLYLLIIVLFNGGLVNVFSLVKTNTTKTKQNNRPPP